METAFLGQFVKVHFDNSMNLTVRQKVFDYLIKNQNRFDEVMDEGTDIKDYIFKMLMDGEWGGYVELEAFSKLLNIQIHIYDSLGSQQPITTVSETRLNLPDKPFTVLSP